MNCSSCGATVPEGARFCPACGHAILSRPDERRVATVVFADLVGFTTFSETADPENVKNLVDSCFDRLAADINAFGGHVDKIVGDALIALFGAPIAHEDDPERAVRAALTLQRTMEGFCAEHGASVELRVGVNTGEVLVGGIRAGDDYTAMGDVVNTASRLQTAASPGQVLVGEATREATSLVVRYEPAGEFVVRGREQPVQTWVACEVLTAPGQRMCRSHVPLVGRGPDLDQICESIRAARNRRRAQLIVLLGEAGVGKSRLAREATAACIGDDTVVLQGECVPYGETNVWWPIGEAVRRALGVEVTDDQEGLEPLVTAAVREALGLADDDTDAARIAEGLLVLMGRIDAPAELDPARVRDEAVRSVQLFLEGLATRRAVVFVLSDLHWADETILELIDTLLNRLRSLPFVLLATARPELLETWTPPSRSDLAVVHVDPLDDAATSALVRAVLGAETPDAIVEVLLEKSGGNPFFIEELAALVAESGVDLDRLVTEGAPESRTHALPATLRGLIAARLDALDPAVRVVLEDCSIAGSTGPIQLVIDLGTARDERDPEALLRELVDRDLVAVDDGEFAFTSDLIREIAYGTLTKAERARRHAAVGNWIRKHGIDRERETDRLEALALHYGTAASLDAELSGVDGIDGDITAMAVQAHEDATAHAERAEAWTRAERHLAAAIALASPDDPDHSSRLLGLARSRVERHQLEEVRPDVDALLATARRSADRALELQALLVLGLLEHRETNFSDAIDAFDLAVGIADELGDKRAIAEGLRGRGLALMFQGDLDSAEDAIQLALEIFRAHDDKRGEAWALQNLAWIAFYRGESTLADERVNAAIEMFSELRDWGGLDWALGLFAWVRFNQGRLEEAEQLAERVLEDSADTGDQWALGMMAVLLAQVGLWSGHPPRAIDRGLEAYERFSAISDRWGMVQSQVPRARAFGCLGRLDEARACIETMARAASDVGDDFLPTLPRLVGAAVACHIGDPSWNDPDIVVLEPGRGPATEEHQNAQALARLQRGDATGARAELEETYAIERNESAIAATGGILALARAADGDPEAAFHLTSDLIELTANSYLDRLQAWMARGLAAAQLRRATDARIAIDRAVEIADATESPLDQTIARLARAVVLDRLDLDAAIHAEEDARSRLARLDLDAHGWSTAFHLAALATGFVITRWALPPLQQRAPA